MLFYLSPTKLWHDVNVMPMRRMFMMLMMIMMKLTKRAKEMRKKRKGYDVDGDDDSSDYNYGKCLMLRPKQPFASKQCKSQRMFSTETLISHWSSIQLAHQSLGTDRDHNVQRATLGLKMEWVSGWWRSGHFLPVQETSCVWDSFLSLSGQCCGYGCWC